LSIDRCGAHVAYAQQTTCLDSTLIQHTQDAHQTACSRRAVASRYAAHIRSCGREPCFCKWYCTRFVRPPKGGRRRVSAKTSSSRPASPSSTQTRRPRHGPCNMQRTTPRHHPPPSGDNRQRISQLTLFTGGVCSVLHRPLSVLPSQRTSPRTLAWPPRLCPLPHHALTRRCRLTIDALLCMRC
jgi:hypothetical protein